MSDPQDGHNANLPEALVSLAAEAGLLTAYKDAYGVPVAVPEETVRRALTTLGIPADDPEQDATVLEHVRLERWQTLLEPSVLIYVDGAEPSSVALCLPPEGSESWPGPGRWTLRYEGDGEDAFRDGAFDPEALAILEQGPDGYTRRSLPLPVALPMGYHSLSIVFASGLEVAAHVIAAPTRCWIPPSLAPPEARTFGLAVQLYGLRGRKDWGMGDFAALREAIDVVAEQGGGALGINPLHALFPTRPDHRSPYSPNSRYFLHPLYIALHEVPEFGNCPAAKEAAVGVAVSGLAEGLKAEAPDLVNYRAVAAAKWPVLEALYKVFRKTHGTARTARGKAFKAFRAEMGERLERFALFEVLSETYQAEGIWIWQDWPAEYQDPVSKACKTFATKHKDRVTYYCWLQFEADRQLGQVQSRARNNGMPLGVYRDLAVGGDATGFDAWALRDSLMEGFGIGAPPDIHNALGQSWGFPPPDPKALLRAGLAPFIEMIRANMRHAGALRMDHALGLMRLFVIPSDRSAAEGIYVMFPLDLLLGVLAIESWRHQCLVVGEDLGTVPDGIRERLAEAAVLSYRLFLFERRDDMTLIPQEEWPRLAAVAASTHDLPTLPGYWAGNDLKWKVDLNLFPNETRRHEAGMARHDDRPRIRWTLGEAGLPLENPDHPFTPPKDLSASLYRWLARTPSLLEMVQIEDVLGQVEQANLPGTLDEHPNWARRMPVPVGQWLADGRLDWVFGQIRAERGVVREE
ncbi:MAG: 4-alpha-glucanotransferase [Rhodospirillaceae bacterium]